MLLSERGTGVAAAFSFIPGNGGGGGGTRDIKVGALLYGGEGGSIGRLLNRGGGGGGGGSCVAGHDGSN